MARFLIAGLLVGLALNLSSANRIEKDVFVYRGRGIKTLSLKPYTKEEVVATIEADIYASQSKIQDNAVSVTMRNVSITVTKNKNKQLNLAECESCATALKEILEPFLILLSDNGKVEAIAVNKNEPELSKNVKLFLATLLQLDRAQIKGLAGPRTERIEPSYAGICPALFQLIGREKDGIVKVQKIVDYGRCKQIAEENSKSDGVTCQKNTCRPAPERKTEWVGVVDATVVEINGKIVPTRLAFEDNICYEPFKKSEAIATGTTRVEVQLAAVLKSSEVPTFVITKETELINRPVFRKVNKDICETPKNKWNWILEESYSAQACQQPYSGAFEDIVERAILCNERL